MPMPVVVPPRPRRPRSPRGRPPISVYMKRIAHLERFVEWPANIPELARIWQILHESYPPKARQGTKASGFFSAVPTPSDF